MTANILSSVRALVNLNEVEVQAFTAILTVRKLRKKEMLLREGEVCKNISFVDRGCLRVFYNVDGLENTIQFFFEHSWYTDYESFLTGRPAYDNVEALSATEVVQFSRTQLEKLYLEYPVFERLGRISAENAFLSVTNRNKLLTNFSPEERYRQLIAERPQLIERVPQHYIASYLGIQPQSLSRIRKRMYTQR